MLKKHKKYSRPRKPFDKLRMDEENILVKNYGLKNKREIWKASDRVGKIREQAKKLITASQEEQKQFLLKFIKLGLIGKNAQIDDMLALSEEDLLKRRLQTIVKKVGIAATPNQARQFITHKHIFVNGNIVNIPSYLVSLEEEKEIKLKQKKSKTKKAALEVEGKLEEESKGSEQLTETEGE